MAYRNHFRSTASIFQAGIFLVGITFTAIVNAGLIDSGSFVADSDTGLDWLKLTETQGQSFAQVSSELGSGGSLEGWSFATSAQLDQLITNAGGTPSSCGNGTAYCGWSSANNGVVDSFLALFGDLTGNSRSEGFLADSSGSQQWTAKFLDSDGFSQAATSDFISTLDNTLPTHLANSGVGSFLVKQASSSVPEPGAPLLLGLALLALQVLQVRRHKPS